MDMHDRKISVRAGVSSAAPLIDLLPAVGIIISILDDL